MRKLSRQGQSSPHRRVIDPNLRALLQTTKRETRLLGDVQRLLLQPGEENGLRLDALHPSEISHSGWCPRASYYRLTGVTPSTEQAGTFWQLQMIYDEGKEIHGKWQKRIWDLGRLAGTFYCRECHYAFPALAPTECEKCHRGRHALTYHEVPLFNQNLNMVGHADGLDGWDGPIIEIKSIGLGTLRFEAPNLIAEHTYKLNINGKPRSFLDYDGLWDSIRRPFPSHMRQGDFYCYMSRKYREVLFLYECKWNQRCKELIVRYQEDRIADRLDMCSRITMALQGGPVPKCPFDGCADCQRYEEKHVNPGRVLVRRSPAASATPEPQGNAGENGQRPASRRLHRSGDR